MQGLVLSLLAGAALMGLNLFIIWLDHVPQPWLGLVIVLSNGAISAVLGWLYRRKELSMISVGCHAIGYGAVLLLYAEKAAPTHILASFVMGCVCATGFAYAALPAKRKRKTSFG